jgi:hypothetical protein
MAATRDDPAVAAAEERVKERANALRVDWQNLKASTRSTLTGRAVIGTVTVVGAFLGDGPGRQQWPGNGPDLRQGQWNAVRQVFSVLVAGSAAAAITRSCKAR